MISKNKPSQVRSFILEALDRGDFKVGDKLPTEVELIRQYGYSRTVIREGLSSLVEDGILTRRQGSGTFVTGVTPRKSRVIAMMVHCVHDRWESMASIIRAIEDEANANGYSLILCNHDGLPEKAFHYVDRLLRDGVAGVVYWPVWHGDATAVNLEVANRLEQASVPFVLIGSPISLQTQSRYSFVGSNGYQASRRLTRHLIQLGHQRIAYIQGLPDVVTSEARFDGFRVAMAEENLTVPPEYVKQIKPVDVEQQGQGEIRELLSANPVPTAVLCVHDILAANVIQELQRLGRRVPDDMAVVGFDDQSFAKKLQPSLTTVRTPQREEGREMVRLLMSKLNGSSQEEKQIYLDCKLVIRESCGAPKELRSKEKNQATISQMQVSR